MKLWIDDVRTPPCDGWIHCRSVYEAKAAINFYEHQRSDDSIIIDLDHDAGEYVKDGGDYIELLKWLEEKCLPDLRYTFHIHSMNPVGVANMRAIIEHNGWKEIK